MVAMAPVPAPTAILCSAATRRRPRRCGRRARGRHCAASAIPGAAPTAVTPGLGPDGKPLPAPPRIVPNPLDNALIIQADAQDYQGILKVLKDLDVPPRQILLEAKIYSVDLTGSWSAGAFLLNSSA